MLGFHFGEHKAVRTAGDTSPWKTLVLHDLKPESGPGSGTGLEGNRVGFVIRIRTGGYDQSVPWLPIRDERTAKIVSALDRLVVIDVEERAAFSLRRHRSLKFPGQLAGIVTLEQLFLPLRPLLRPEVGDPTAQLTPQLIEALALLGSGKSDLR